MEIEAVSSDTLFQALANPVEAERTYKGKTIRVSGKISRGVSIDENGGIYVKIFGFLGLQELCAYVSDLNNSSLYSESEVQVTIEGRVSEIKSTFGLFDIIMMDCKIISAN